MFPIVSYAAVTVGWNATSTDKGVIQPNAVNGNVPGINITSIIGASLSSCAGASNALTWINGQFGCNSISSGGGTSNVSTSSSETSGRIPFWTSTSATPALLSGGSSDLTFDGTRFITTYASTTQLTASDNGLFGGNGGIDLYAVGSGNGTIGFNTVGAYVAGINGFGGLFQFTSSDGKLIYLPSPSASAGASRSFGNGFTVLANGNFGISSTSPGSLLSVGNTSGINFSTGTTTSSALGGFDISAGCFAIRGVCISGGSSSGTNFFTSSGANTYLNTGSNLQAPSFEATSTLASIFPYASTTAITAVTASSSNLFGASLIPCTGTNFLQWNAGAFFCSATAVGTVTAVTGTWPILSSGGNTPNITWGGIATSSPLIAGQIVYSTGVNTVGQSATTSIGCSGNISCTGFVGLGSASTIAFTGTLPIANGGTNNTTFPNNSILYFDGTKIAATSSTLYSGNFVATTTLASQFPYASTTQITIGDGTVSNPALAFSADPDTGIYRNNTNGLGLAGGGAGLTWDGSQFYPNTTNARNLGIISTNIWNKIFVNYASTTAASGVNSYFNYASSTAISATNAYLTYASTTALNATNGYVTYASSTAISASNLTSGNCVQASTGGLLTTASSACGGSLTVTASSSLSSGNDQINASWTKSMTTGKSYIIDTNCSIGSAGVSIGLNIGNPGGGTTTIAKASVSGLGFSNNGMSGAYTSTTTGTAQIEIVNLDSGDAIVACRYPGLRVTE